MRLPARIAQNPIFIVVMIGIMLISPLPFTASASTDLVSGQSAIVSNTGGDPINLRSKPDTTSKVTGAAYEGQIVDIVEGPIWSDDGIAWYKIVADGQRAYISAEFLSATGGDSSSAVVTGNATISNTGGDGINCRSGAGSDYSVIAVFVEGDAVELAGDAIGAWQPIFCGGSVGYVHTDFLGTQTVAAASETATIVKTGGDPINCRARANSKATVLTVFYEGDTVTLNGSLVNTWQPVLCAGTTGYIKKTYLSKTVGGDTSSDTSGGSSTATTTGTGVISDTNGDGANCRAKGSTSATVITVLAEGTSVGLRGDGNGSWVPVVCAGKKGYVSAQFVMINDGGTGGGSTSGYSSGDQVVVANTGGQGVRLRSKASSTASIIVVLPEGQGLVVRSGSSGDWVAVTYRTSNGFVHKDYLTLGTASTPTPTPTSDSGALKANDHALVTDLVNFREGASLTANVISSVDEGTVVLVTGAKKNGFYPVQVAGFAGFIHGDYLQYTNKDLTGVDGSGGVTGDQPGNGAITPQGRKMINYAMKYLGYPYVWATHGPDTFDCSGFTYWVTLKTLKADIGAGTWSQSISGTAVAYSDLRPGDLVFFQNTFTWGLSHVGIYIGDGKFIHAENETTGVVISSLTSTYYATRWYGARRITTD